MATGRYHEGRKLSVNVDVEAVDEAYDELDAEEVARLARRTRVMFLRNGGAPWHKIAQALGVSVSTARHDYTVVCRDLNNEDPAHVVARHRSVIFDVQRAMYPRLMGSNFAEARDAAAVILRALEREAKLLGLDSPTRVLASLSSEDFAQEAARLIDTIATTDEAALKELTQSGGLDQDDVIDAVYIEDSGDVEDRTAEPTERPKFPQPDALPDSDDEWSNL